MDQSSAIATDIKRLVADKLGVEFAVISDDQSFKMDLEMDSLDFYELILDLEKKYNIVIPEENAEKLTTVSSLIDYIREHAHH